jgi:hypothetical protein
VRLGGDRPILLPGDEVVSLRRQGGKLPPQPLGEQAVLSNGDRVPLDPAAGLRLGDEVLSARPLEPLRAAAGDVLRLPLSRLAVLWLFAPRGADDTAMFLRGLAQGERSRDQVLLRNGDLIEGTVVSLDRAGGCKVRVGNKVVETPCARVAAVAFSTELLARARPKGVFGHLVLANGCRLSLVSAAVDAERGRLTGKTVFGATVEVALGDVVALDLRQGRAVYLSDLTPSEYVHTPFLAVSWPFVRDGSAAGRAMLLPGGTYDKGLGMHADSRITYALNRRYDWFEAAVGLDRETGMRGRVRVEVLVDGKAQVVGPDREITAADAPLVLRIRVRGASQLTLAVRGGRFGDVQAHVNWADARLITSK